MKVVAFNGSPRKNGNTALLIETVLERLRDADIETEHVQLAGTRLAGCIACMKCREHRDGACAVKADALNVCLEKMLAADGIIIGSPVYFADITANTKALLERAGFVARGNKMALRRKVGAGVLAARRAGAVHSLDSIDHFFQANEMVIVGSSYWNFALGNQVGEVLDDEEGLDTMRTLGDNMVWVMERLYG